MVSVTNLLEKGRPTDSGKEVMTPYHERNPPFGGTVSQICLQPLKPELHLKKDL